MEKQALFKIRGMQRDLCESAFNPEYAYEIKNMRVYPTQFNTLFSLINEKGTLDTNLEINGYPLGSITLNNSIIIFSTDNNGKDYIYKFYYNVNNVLIKKVLYDSSIINCSLGFNIDNPIETLGYYENEKIQKVYWTDGLNHPRSINIANDYTSSTGIILNNTDTQFDLQSYLPYNETITINKNLNVNGVFKAGIIQYCFTYSNKYGKESNIFYTSPLYYSSISAIDQRAERGGTPEESTSINNSFDINITINSNYYEYINIYSIFRSSLNEIPTCKKVTSKLINLGNTITYTDTGIEGETILPTALLSIGCSNIVIGTMAQKDNVLFYGDITSKKITFNKDDKATLKENSTITWNIDNVQKELTSSITEHNIYDYKIQLDNNSQEIKTFKKGEQYRLGIQFQDVWGEWSEVVYLGDSECTQNIKTDYYTNNSIWLPSAKCTINLPDTILLTKLYNNGYRRYRPVIAFLPPEKRKFICEGVLNPTVFNIRERIKGVFSRASWFFRPNMAFELPKYTEEPETDDINNKWLEGTFTSNSYLNEYTSTLYKLYDCVGDDKTIYSYLPHNRNNGFLWYDGTNLFESNGTYCEFRHMRALPANRFRNSEIQGMFATKRYILNDGVFKDTSDNAFLEDDNYYNGKLTTSILAPMLTPTDTTYKYPTEAINGYLNRFENVFCVDQNIITLNSPDIQLNSEDPIYDVGAFLNNKNNFQLVITGIIPITASNGDTFIDQDIDYKPVASGTEYHENPVLDFNINNTVNYSRFAFRKVLTSNIWCDYIYNATNRWHDGTDNDDTVLGFINKYKNIKYVIYPFHSKFGSNAPSEQSIIANKYLYNMQFSFNSYYLNSSITYEIPDIKYSTKDGFNNSLKTDFGEISYAGNSNFETRSDNFYHIFINGAGDYQSTRAGNYLTSEYYAPLLLGAANRKTHRSGAVHGTPEDFAIEFPISYSSGTTDYRDVTNCFRNTSVQMNYKSSPHIVMSLSDTIKDTNKNFQTILPTIKGLNDLDINSRNYTFSEPDEILFFDKDKHYSGFYQDSIPLTEIGNTGIEALKNSPQMGFLWLGTLYNPNGGFTSNPDENTLANETWLPCGDAKLINTNSTRLSLDYLEGDIYYQRFDCLKTYPTGEKTSINNIIEILSFMCCGHQNIDGRYDFNATNTPINNRLNIDSTYSLLATPNNYSLLNKIYSQNNNYFTQVYTDNTDIDVKSFKNTFGWTKTKIAGAEKDVWTQLDLLNTSDLDGDKGTIQAIRKYNNNLYAFQNTGISTILYNNRTQISTADGNPIQLATSGTVDGKQYLTETLGCSNKWSICSAKSGLWFIDDITKGIYCFTDKFENMSDKLGFHSWINQNSINTGSWNINKWINTSNLNDHKSFITQYDKVNGDIFFINKNDCLCFSENLGQFSSFYSYENTPYMINLKDKFFHIHNLNTVYKLWESQEGDYNSFYGTLKPYWVEIIANPDYYKEKIFDTLAFNATTYSSYTGNNNGLSGTKNTIATNTTNGQEISSFKSLICWNDYQTGQKVLNYNLNQLDSIRKKFDMYRTLIPRDTVNSNYRDRLCSPYLHIKLSSESKHLDHNTTILQNMLVTYSE